jgi:hypothetical protein
MRRQQKAASNAEIARQATRMQEEFPELFAYLQQRDAKLERARFWIAMRHDVESCATNNPWMRIEAVLEDLDPGIAEVTH